MYGLGKEKKKKERFIWDLTTASVSNSIGEFLIFLPTRSSALHVTYDNWELYSNPNTYLVADAVVTGSVSTSGDSVRSYGLTSATHLRRRLVYVQAQFINYSNEYIVPCGVRSYLFTHFILNLSTTNFTSV